MITYSFWRNRLHILHIMSLAGSLITLERMGGVGCKTLYWPLSITGMSLDALHIRATEKLSGLLRTVDCLPVKWGNYCDDAGF